MSFTELKQKDKDYIIATRNEYLEIQFITSKSYSFVEIYIMPIYQVEQDRRDKTIIYNSGSDILYFDRENDLYLFKYNLPQEDLDLGDYFAIVYGIGDSGEKEEEYRFNLTIS